MALPGGSRVGESLVNPGKEHRQMPREEMAAQTQPPWPWASGGNADPEWGFIRCDAVS